MTYLRNPPTVKDFRKQTNVSCQPLHVKPTEILADNIFTNYEWLSFKLRSGSLFMCYKQGIKLKRLKMVLSCLFILTIAFHTSPQIP